MNSLGHFLWIMWDLPAGTIWSNIVASIVWSIGAGVIAYVVHGKTIRKLEEHHEKMKDLLDPSTPGGITDAITAIQEQQNV